MILKSPEGPEILHSSEHRLSPFEGAQNSRINLNRQRSIDYLTGCSPTSAVAAASYFNKNFDENGYVFDGVKIEVNILKFFLNL